MKLRKISAIFLVCALVIGVLAIGCAPARRPITPRTVPRTTPNLTPAPTQTPITTPNQTPMRTTTKSGMESKVEAEVNKIPGASNAVVLINNNTAYVGIDLDGDIEDVRTNDIKDEVITEVKKVDPSITKVYVSADVDVVGRLRGYGRDLRGGKPISGFMDELEEMFRRPLPRTNQ